MILSIYYRLFVLLLLWLVYNTATRLILSVEGFSSLSFDSRSKLLRNALYPVMLLLSSEDFDKSTDNYNLFSARPSRGTVSRLVDQIPEFKVS